ncbi:MAG: hypothetical protein ACTSO9_21670 [Candidatus Helarchaeota archaeon]
MRSAQINVVLAIRMDITCKELIKEYWLRDADDQDLNFLKNAIDNNKVKRKLKKEVERKRKELEMTHHILDIYFIPGYEYWESDPPDDYDWFWTELFFQDELDYDEFIEMNRDGLVCWEFGSSTNYIEILFMTLPKW